MWDKSWRIWQRRYALRAIANLPIGVYMPQLKDHMERGLSKWAEILKNHPDPEHAHLGQDILDDIRDFVAHQPTNRAWFFDVLDAFPNPLVKRDFLISSIYYSQPEEFRHLLLTKLLHLLEMNPRLITPSTIKTLMFQDDPLVQDWLRQRFEHEVEAWEAERKQPKTHKSADVPDYRLLPAFQYLDGIYKSAVEGDEKAYSNLVKLAKRGKRIPLRAVATHFIGKLQSQYKTTEVLCYLMRYANDN